MLISAMTYMHPSLAANNVRTRNFNKLVLHLLSQLKHIESTKPEYVKYWIGVYIASANKILEPFQPKLTMHYS